MLEKERKSECESVTVCVGDRVYVNESVCVIVGVNRSESVIEKGMEWERERVS